MKSFHDKLVFEHDGEVTIARKDRHIELTAPGYFARIDRPYMHSIVRLGSVIEKARYDSNETLAVVRYGHDELIRFEKSEEANLFVIRLQREIQALLKEREDEIDAFPPAGNMAMAFGRRIAEWLGIIVTGGAIAFTGAVMAVPGWKYGEHLFRQFGQSEQARMMTEIRSLTTPAGEASISATLAGLETAGISAEFRKEVREQQMKKAEAWIKAQHQPDDGK